MPWKHYVFGKLIAKTPNAYKIRGEIIWDYHVAPIIRLKDDRLYILDPALSANPIMQDDWYKMLVTNPNLHNLNRHNTGSGITGSVSCVETAISYYSNCFNVEQVDEPIFMGQLEALFDE